MMFRWAPRRVEAHDDENIQTHMGKHKNKRTRTDKSSSESETESMEVATMSNGLPITTKKDWPRFLVMQGKEEGDSVSLSRLSPFAVQKGIQGLAGEVENIKKLRSGDILITLNKEMHAILLLKTEKFINIAVKIEPHKSLNSSKGVIRCRELKDCSEEEILEEMATQHVSAVKKINIKKNGRIEATGTVILTFSQPKIPSSVKVGYLKVPVSPYIPNPMRCFNCQEYGHGSKGCKKDAICPKCSTTGHLENDCHNAPKCLHCNEDHPVYDKKCPKWILEKEIQAVKVTRDLSFKEARDAVSARTPQQNSYAQAAAPPSTKKRTADSGSQTDYTWPNEEESPKIITPSSPMKKSKDQSSQASARPKENTAQIKSSTNQTKSQSGKSGPIINRGRSLYRTPRDRDREADRERGFWRITGEVCSEDESSAPPGQVKLKGGRTISLEDLKKNS